MGIRQVLSAKAPHLVTKLLFFCSKSCFWSFLFSTTGGRGSVVEIRSPKNPPRVFFSCSLDRIYPKWHRIGRKSRQNGSQIGPMWLSRLGARTETTKSCYPGDPRPPNWSRFGVEWLYFGASWCPIRFFLALARTRLGIHDFLCSTNLDAPNIILYLDQL